MLVMTLPVLVTPMAVAKLVTTNPRIGVHTVVFASFAALLLGTAGLFLLTPTGGWAVVLPAMVLLGLGFGLPIGLVDGHALAAVPAERSGTAAGVLNFFRVGSEALFVAIYAVVLERLVSTRLQGEDAHRTAAGQYLHPDVYQWAFDWIVGGILALVAVTTVAVTVLRRGRRATD